MTHHPAPSIIRARSGFLLRAWFAFMALCLVVPVMAATPLDETRPLHPEGRFVLSTNLGGKIEIQVWDRPEVYLEGTLADDVEDLSISASGCQVEISIKYPDETSSLFGIFSFRRPGRGIEPSHLRVTIPRTASVNVKNVSADINVEGVAGSKLAISNVSGDIVARGTPLEAEVKTVSGEILLELDGSREVEADSVSGDITVRGRLSGRFALASVSGELEIDTRGAAVERLNLNTVAGDARIHAALAAGGRIAASSLSGDVELIAPANLSARVSGKSFSGRLRLPDVDPQGNQTTGINGSFEHRYGDGDGDVRLETFSGNVRLKLEAADAQAI